MVSQTLSSSLSTMRCERAWVEIDLDALAHNVCQFKQLLSPSVELMVMVKADAYGHGAVAVAHTVIQHGASWLGVATIAEGIELREGGVVAPILLLGVANSVEEVRAIVHWKLQPTICTPRQALICSEILGETEPKAALPVHLKIDTGMSRLGIGWQQAIELIKLVAHLPYLQIESIYSHLATADDIDLSNMYLQNSRYQAVWTKLNEINISLPRLHIANSAATLVDTALHYNMVRVGLGIYGLSPAAHLQAYIPLKPVLQVKARVTQVKTIPIGTAVSYGSSYVVKQETLIAVVGIGYADGVPRNLSNRLTVLIRGRRVPQIGAITMDQLMLDVSAIPDLREGEIVTLLGQDGEESISANDWATLLNTISWEILCGFKPRLPRILLSITDR
jgi:alanine racemase